MSRSNVRTIGAMLAVIFSFAIPAVAQNPSAGAAPSASTATWFPAWAYPWVPDFKLPPDDGVPRRVPDSTATFTITQERDLFFSPDWHPEDHAPMPEVVAHGRKPDVRACGSCHRAEGTGGPENANLAGLPAAYIVQQMADYKSGARKFSGPQRSPNVLMTAIAKAANDDEIQAAATYFSALKRKSNIKVVETDTVPKTYIARVFVAKLANGGTEPLGQRIVEVPVDVDQFEHRDSRSQFMVYAPVGSIAKGEALVKTGGASQTVACTICHGTDLKGVGTIPGIAGRSPSYVVRQLYDFKQGTRAGSGSALMKPAVEKLTEEDMVSLAAYLASLTP
jgi:cytochrome c553